MPAPKPISREYRIYLALWRKALKSPEMVIIKAPNTNMAIAMRQGMYRAIKPFRYGAASDTELLSACEKFVVFLVKGAKPDDPAFLELRERKTLGVLEADWDSLGLDEEDLLLGDERHTYEEMKKLLPENVKPGQRATPFFTREE